MNTSLTRNVPYWALFALSVASAAVGGWLIAGQIGTMTARLLDGTATNVEVYVGPSIVVVGAVLLGAGVVGILLALVLAAVKSLLRAPAAVAESAGHSREPETDAVADTAEVTEEDLADTTDAADDAEDEQVPAAEPALTK